MNKKLLAVAIAGVLAAPLAQAQTANVTLYGRLNLSTQVIINAKQDASGGGLKENLYQVNSNSSRLGVRGTESLGGGLNAIFQAEERFDATNAGAVSLAGDSFVGLQGGWGTAKIGYFLTPYDDVSPVFGSVPTLITSILGTQSLWSNSGYAGNSIDTGAFDDRAANSLRYDSPVISGFTFSGQIFARDQSSGDGGGGDPLLSQQRRHAYGMSFGSTYNNGPISGGIAYEFHNNMRLSGTGYNGLAQGCNPVGSCNNKLQDQGLTIAGAYQFGAWKFAAVGEWLKYDVPTAANPNGELKRSLWGISTTGNIGPGQLYAAYFKANNGRGSGTCTTAGSGLTAVTTCPVVGGLVLGNETSSQQWEVSYTYPLSKRTLLYTGYVMIDNAKNAAYNFGVGSVQGLCLGNPSSNAGGAQVGCGDAARPQGVVAGIVHFW